MTSDTKRAKGREYLERELNSRRSPIVRYVPSPDSICNGFNEDAPLEWSARWVPSDLPSVCIERHNASCHICLADFEEPPLRSSVTHQRESDDAEEMEPLRRLACRHVFHQLCIDSYLDSVESDRYPCPICHGSVVTVFTCLEQWQAEFYQFISAHPKKLEHHKSNIQELEGSPSGPRRMAFRNDSQEFDKDGLLVRTKYKFNPNNKYLGRTSPKRSLQEKAKTLFEKKGTFSEVALLLEAAIQQGDLGEGGYETWILLGENRMSDYREKESLHALTEGVRRSLAVGVPAGMLSLAALYVGKFPKACGALLLYWLRLRLPTMLIPEEIHKAVLAHSSGDVYDSITDSFIAIIHAQRTENITDSEMEIALGILFHNKNDFFNARACYASALAARPRDFCLWNTLTVVLLGCKMFEESSEANNEALRLCPTRTRAIFNKGGIFYDRGIYKKAAEHYLSVLALQESAGEEAAAYVWNQVQSTLLIMKQNELANISRIGAGTNLDVYRKEGFEFLDVSNIGTQSSTQKEDTKRNRNRHRKGKGNGNGNGNGKRNEKGNGNGKSQGKDRK